VLESKYVENKDIPYFDGEVSKAICDYPIDGGGKDMIVGVQNFDGDVYRIIKATGMGAYIHVTSELAEIGLKDELANSLSGKGGFDSIFVTTEDLKRQRMVRALDARPTAIEDIQSIETSLSKCSETERTSIIQSRLGQGLFRDKLIKYWGGCAVTDCEFAPLLRASHIKPWRASDNVERLDVFNGLLLAPNLDVAFDAGYISFDDSGKIIISDFFDNQHAYSLRITPKLKVKSKLLNDEHKKYLEHHRANVLLHG